VAQRPHVVLSAAVSLDGYLDDASGTRLVLSGPEDLDQVDELRASCDAILVGARTVRRDNPRLLVRSAARRAARVARGLPPSPAKVAVSGSGDLDPAARFFTDEPGGTGDPGYGRAAEPGRVARLVYVPDGAVPVARARLGAAATVTGAGDPLEWHAVLADLARRGTARLLVEGGGRVLRQFLDLGLADELRLAVAPVLVGDPAAPRLWQDGSPGPLAPGPAHRMTLAAAAACGDTAVLWYLPGSRS
jgi:5-amino-6-(5-phosphoribosylamino)uracil reductase